MNRVGNLYETLTSIEIAKTAIIHGTENKRNNYDVHRRFCYEDSDPLHAGRIDPVKCDKEADKLVNIIQTGWQPMPLREKHIEPPGLKPRDLQIPTLTDHLIGWMLIETIRPVMMRGMYEHTYGSIPGRGIDAARRTVERWVQHDSKCKYFVKLDIHHFYPNIDHDILKAQFREKIKDEKVLHVIDQTIDMTDSGVPIGAYPSQWFGNFYLTGLDHYITQDLYKLRRGKRTNYVRHYMRYMDDMLLIGTSKSDLEKAVRKIIRYCEQNLNVQIKPCWEIKAIDEYPIDIVGYRFFRDHTDLRGGIFLHCSRLARKINKRLDQRGQILVADARAMTSLHGWCEKADSIHFINTYIKPYVNLNLMKEVVSYADKNQLIGDASCVYCRAGGKPGNYHILYGRNRGAVRWRKPDCSPVLRCDCVDDYTQLDFWSLLQN